jgi:hypothetical protein
MAFDLFDRTDFSNTIKSSIQQAVWLYGGATNIFSTFCSLIGFSSSRRIQPSNRINNELLFINLAAVRADDFQIPPHRQAVPLHAMPLGTIFLKGKFCKCLSYVEIEPAR